MRLAEWVFRNRRTGAIVVGQWPNWPLALFIVAVSLQWVGDAMQGETWARISHTSGVAATFFLAWWSLDELVRGVNPWRRFLGTAGLLYVAWRAVLSL